VEEGKPEVSPSFAARRKVPTTRHQTRRRIVVDMRGSFQQTMREDPSAAVEMLTERMVIAFMSDSQLEPDYSVEVFVLEPVA
jgi:uncharacterized protein YbcI